MPALGRPEEFGGEGVTLGIVAVAQLYHVGYREEADEIYQDLEAVVCGDRLETSGFVKTKTIALPSVHCTYVAHPGSLNPLVPYILSALKNPNFTINVHSQPCGYKLILIEHL